MIKLNIEVEALVARSVKVKFNLLVRADDDAKVATIIKQFAKGNLRTTNADVEGIEFEAQDEDESLEAHLENIWDEGGQIKVLTSTVTDSR